MPQTLSQKSQCVPTHSLWLSVSGPRPAARKMCPGNIRSLCYKSYNYIPMPPPFSWDAHLILKKKQNNPVLCPRFWWTSSLGNRYVCWKDRPSGIFHRERVTWSKLTKHNRKFTFKQRQTEMLTFPSLWLNENTHVGSQAEGSYAWGMHHQKQNNLEVLWTKDG